MHSKSVKKTLSIRLTVLGIFIAVAGLTAGLSLGLQYYFSRNLARTAAESAFRTTSEKVGERIASLDRQSTNMVGVLSHFNALANFPETIQERLSLPLLGGAMEQNPSLYAMYVGYSNGDFFEMVNLESGGNVRKAYAAAPHDRWVVVRVRTLNGIRVKTSSFLDSGFNKRIDREEVTDYDPRKRPWFKLALSETVITRTAPYIFSNLKAPGVTYAKSMDRGQRVVALDISLAGMTDFLQRQRLLPDSQAFLFDNEGNIIAGTSPDNFHQQKKTSASITLSQEEESFIRANPRIRASNEMDWPPFDFAMSGTPKGYSIDLLNLLARKSGFRVDYVNGYSWSELVELFKKGDLDLLHSLLRNPNREKLGVFTKQYMPMPQAIVVKAGVSLPSSLADLKGKTVAIPKGWATDTYLEKNHPEIERLHVATTLDAMRAVATGKAYATLDSVPVLRYLAAFYFLDDLQIGGSPPELTGAERQGLHFLVRSEKAILASILDKAMATVTRDEWTALENKWFGKGEQADERQPNAGTVPHRQLLELSKNAGPTGNLRSMTINSKEHLGYVVRMESVYGSEQFLGLLVPTESIMRPYMKKVNFSLLVTLGLLLLLTPIVLYCATIIVKPIKVLAQESEKVRQRKYDEVALVKSNITEILDLSRSMCSMASAIKTYEKSLEELMDSFIQLIATAIDHKSPYTGGHCERVPKLSVMLARAANASTDGPLGGFSLTTDDEWREFRTAAWLHDCGKVCTPEYIVDKSTKLETIYNRIHEVRMRFEVLLREAEIQYWQDVAQGGDREALLQTLNAKRREIEEDFAFIAECNIGGEFMAEDRIERVKEIAQKTWTRHLDDRLGLGPLELMRYSSEIKDLPCEEPLLADRPEHIVQHPKKKSLGGEDMDFALTAPEHLYNHGEIYNLCITRGTLTAEDRFKIQEHVINTIQMLEKLPYPENMTKIPEYAGSHHETLVGSGYPRKISGEDISIPARIMALADVFEALTASDRPYKKAKTLSEAVRILSFMVKDQHLDADIFKLFLENRVYLEYAEQFLDPSQIDEVDVEGYLKQLA